ncbi:MAG TPA: hypothetical protein VIF14_03900 [Alphaproteobacteria bacterium]|jgi:hypothetical protein
MARHTRKLWTFEPERRELAEHLGPPILRALSWALAAILAAPIFLSLLLPFLV